MHNNLANILLQAVQISPRRSITSRGHSPFISKIPVCTSTLRSRSGGDNKLEQGQAEFDRFAAHLNLAEAATSLENSSGNERRTGSCD